MSYDMVDDAQVDDIPDSWAAFISEDAMSYSLFEVRTIYPYRCVRDALQASTLWTINRAGHAEAQVSDEITLDAIRLFCTSGRSLSSRLQ